MHKRASPEPAPVTARVAAAPTAARVAQPRLPTHDISRVPIADVSGRDATAQLRAARPDAAPAYRAPGRTGLPGGLKAGIEARSGLSMDRVRVHYSSSEPAQLNAHAFTRGSDIHLAPGQQRHLPHEAWHVVQQAQGRVRATLDVRGVGVNDDPALEREADTLGGSSAVHGANLLASGTARPAAEPVAAPAQLCTADPCVQRVIEIEDGDLEGTYKSRNASKELIEQVKSAIGDELKRGWIGHVIELAGDKVVTTYADSDEFLDALKDAYEKTGSSSKKVRPNFPKSSYTLGAYTREIQTGKDQSKLKPSEENLALPHRFPFGAIKQSTDLFLSGTETSTDLDRWTDRLLEATEQRLDLNLPKIKDKKRKKYYEDTVNKQIDDTRDARKKFKAEVQSGSKLDLTSPETQEFLKNVNALHGNIPDYGPHVGVNIQVSDRTHLNFDESGTLTPGSYAAGTMSPHRGRGIARTSDGKYIVTTGGSRLDPEELDKKLQKLLKDRGYDDTTIDKDDLEDMEVI
jgi:hypothetical protein